MATYLENSISVNENSVIEYSLSLWGTPPIKVYVGQSTKKGHLGKLTFLDENKEDTIFGNGCRFRNIEGVIEYIKSDIKQQINQGKPPRELKIDGAVVTMYLEVHGISI